MSDDLNGPDARTTGEGDAGRRPAGEALCGLLVIDKEPGFTSMDVCAIVRRKLRRGGAPKRVKVGHGGTLDPLATGVLVVLIGKATPLCNAIMVGTKEYEARVDLSRTSTSDDLGGEVTDVVVAEPPSREVVARAVRAFEGKIQQRPPDFSAMHVGGVRAYELARRGERPTLSEREVHVHEVEVVSYEWPVATLRVLSGKGVYIRSIARDLGRALGVGGLLSSLRRTRVGEFSLDRAVKVKSLPEALRQADLMPVPGSLGAASRGLSAGDVPPELDG